MAKKMNKGEQKLGKNNLHLFIYCHISFPIRGNGMTQLISSYPQNFSTKDRLIWFPCTLHN